MDRDDGDIFDFLASDILRELQMHWPGALFHGHAEGIAHGGRNRGRADDLSRHFRERLHRSHDIHDLEPCLLGAHHRLLPRDENHRPRAEVGIGRAGGEIQRARAERRQAYTGPAGEPAVGGGHECGRLLVAGEHQLDVRGPERLEKVQILLARDTKDAVDAFVLQRFDQ
ncbi:hypothetical protein D3C71_1623370 [compost metagenome]